MLCIQSKPSFIFRLKGFPTDRKEALSRMHIIQVILLLTCFPFVTLFDNQWLFSRTYINGGISLCNISLYIVGNTNNETHWVFTYDIGKYICSISPKKIKVHTTSDKVKFRSYYAEIFVHMDINKKLTDQFFIINKLFRQFSFFQ